MRRDKKVGGETEFVMWRTWIQTAHVQQAAVTSAREGNRPGLRHQVVRIIIISRSLHFWVMNLRTVKVKGPILILFTKHL